MNPIEEIKSVLMEVGCERYGMEAVDQLQHALQSACLAEQDGASPELITAALLHDIGHLVDKKFDGAAEAGIDRKHEDIGAGYLSKWMGPAVTEPIAMHVDAKRYLCAVDEEYFATLSDASVHSLRLQGGVYSADEADEFISQPFACDAVRLRRWDDLAKDPEAKTESLEHYMDIVSKALTSSSVEQA